MEQQVYLGGTGYLGRKTGYLGETGLYGGNRFFLGETSLSAYLCSLHKTLYQMMPTSQQIAT